MIFPTREGPAKQVQECLRAKRILPSFPHPQDERFLSLDAKPTIGDVPVSQEQVPGFLVTVHPNLRRDP